MASPAPRPDRDPELDPRRLYGERWYVGRMSYDEYRRHAETSDFKLEYVAGAVYAMASGTVAHAVIAGNIGLQLQLLARAAGCRAHSSILSVRTPAGDEFIPDNFVDCGPRPPDSVHRTETPCLIVEVLSPSTASTDLHVKRDAYETIPTLGAYLIVEADWRGVYRHWRDDAGVWREETVVGAGTLPLPCPTGGALALDDIYDGLDLPPMPPPRPPRLRRVREAEPV